MSRPNLIRSIGSCPSPRVAQRALARFNSSFSHDATSEAESSTRPGKGQAYPNETPDEAFKRNLREVQAYRRRKEAQRPSMFLPTSKIPERTPLQASLSTLLASGAALGHSTSLLHPAYTPFIYGNRSGLSIIDLEQSLPILRRTAALVRDVVKADGTVLIVGTRDGLGRCMDKAKARLGDNGFITQKWLPGTLTNAQTFFGIDAMQNNAHLPDLVIFLNPSENFGAIRECTALNIPSVGIIDSDTDPRIVTYPIPANMESIRTSELIIGTLSIAGQEGRRLRLKEADERARRQQQSRQS